MFHFCAGSFFLQVAFDSAKSYWSREVTVNLPLAVSSFAFRKMDSSKKASEMVATLDLKAHPDGGFYAETFRDPSISLSKSQLPPRCTHSLSLVSKFSFSLISSRN